MYARAGSVLINKLKKKPQHGAAPHYHGFRENPASANRLYLANSVKVLLGATLTVREFCGRMSRMEIAFPPLSLVSVPATPAEVPVPDPGELGWNLDRSSLTGGSSKEFETNIIKYYI